MNISKCICFYRKHGDAEDRFEIANEATEEFHDLRVKLTELRGELRISKVLVAEFSDAAQVMPRELADLRKDQERYLAMIKHEWYVKEYKEFYAVFDETGEVSRGLGPNAIIDAAMEAERERD